MELLRSLTAGQPIIYAGNKMTAVPPEVAGVFVEGDRLVIVNSTGALLHIPAAEWDVAERAVSRAVAAFGQMGAVSNDQISTFYAEFATRLQNDKTFNPILKANEADVAQAKSRGRSATRLELTPKMRTDMIDGLHLWRNSTGQRDEVIDKVDHEGWHVEQRVAGLGTVGFVFEGRPNVFADACGVLRGGNTVVFRIGSDALGTAQAIVSHALDPALEAAGLPSGAASLVESPARSAGWALFSDQRLSLAVARGSGAAVSQLGAVAQQNGIPVSLHGTGGAWMVTGQSCDSVALQAAVEFSLDRKVCNTLNTCCVLRSRADELLPAVLSGLDAAAAARSTSAKIHVAKGSDHELLAERSTKTVTINRSEGDIDEPQAEPLLLAEIGIEWEWENSPEVTIVLVDSVDEAVALCNQYSPRFTVSLISEDVDEHDKFWQVIDAPFVGNGFTRWVDGQYALARPELGLSNWEYGRLFGRGAVLSGDSVYTVRTRAFQTDTHVRR